jgi:hypothetical protein
VLVGIISAAFEEMVVVDGRKASVIEWDLNQLNR